MRVSQPREYGTLQARETGAREEERVVTVVKWQSKTFEKKTRKEGLKKSGQWIANLQLRSNESFSKSARERNRHQIQEKKGVDTQGQPVT